MAGPALSGPLDPGRWPPIRRKDCTNPLTHVSPTPAPRLTGGGMRITRVSPGAAGLSKHRWDGEG